MENEMEAENINAGEFFRRPRIMVTPAPNVACMFGELIAKLSSSSCAVVKEQKSS